MGIDVLSAPWPAWQWNESVEVWGTTIDARRAMTKLEAYEPSTKPMKPVPLYTYAQALGIDDDGNQVTEDERTQDMIRSRFRRVD